MREQVASLTTAQAAAADLAVILATVRATLGGTEGRAAGNLLEMAERFPGSRRWWCLSPRLVRRSRRPIIVVGQGELF